MENQRQIIGPPKEINVDSPSAANRVKGSFTSRTDESTFFVDDNHTPQRRSSAPSRSSTATPTSTANEPGVDGLRLLECESIQTKISGEDDSNSENSNTSNINNASNSNSNSDMKNKKLIDDKFFNVGRDGIMFVFVALIFVVYILVASGNGASKGMAGPLSSSLQTCTTTAIVFLIGTSRLSSASTHGDRILLILVLTMILMSAVLAMFALTSPCTNCIFYSIGGTGSSTVSSPASSYHPKHQTAGGLDMWQMWDILFSNEEEELGMTATCRQCVSGLMTFSMFFVPFDLTPSKNARNPVPEIEELHIEATTLREDFGELAAWYVHYEKERSNLDKKKFTTNIAQKLQNYGYLHDGDDLSDTMRDYLCSPISRFDKPDPVKFLSDLKRSRFSGEMNLSNMSTATLQRIMRGDILQELGVSLCFMLRFALSLSKDPNIEATPITYTNIAPMKTEVELKSYDITTHLPGVVIPQIDQDIDPTGETTAQFEKIMKFFTQFPYEDDPIYFDTKEEYYAFYRWELENTLDDEWFFPTWLRQGEKKEQMADLIAYQLKHAPDFIKFENTHDDVTLSDRVFYGTAQQWLAPIKLPGIDEDYDYFFPMRDQDMLTNSHREFFRYKQKPTIEQLFHMVKSFHPDHFMNCTVGDDRATAVSTMIEWKDKILQVDGAIVATLYSRPGQFYSPGAILYLDAETRMPMGIYQPLRNRIFLPTEGRDWLHAKYFFGVNERGLLASSHVLTSHFGWSHPISTAAWQTLPHDHGLRVLLKPFTLNSHSVNSAAWNMLIRDHSILTHASGTQTAHVSDVLHVVYAPIDYSKTVPDLLDDHGLDDIINTTELPLFGQGRRLYDTHRKFANDFVTFLYDSDESMLEDDSVIRFWHHANTFGRHLDPCVCDMETDLFFADNGKWPSNEKTHTCEELMDHEEYRLEQNIVSRRQQWCKRGQFDRIKSLRSLMDATCEKTNSADCKVLYDIHYMKPHMGLKPLKTRSQLVDFVATVMWQITAGHEVNGDNVSYMSDPEFCGVRMREFDENGDLPLKADLGTYIYGLSIASLTTVRGPPLLADWSPLYEYYASAMKKKKNLSSQERMDLIQTMDDIHKTYKYSLVDLSFDFLKESTSRRTNQQSNDFNPAVQLSSISV